MPVSQKNLAQLIGGALLTLAGVVGLFYSPRVQRRGLRFTAFAVSILSIGAGLYLFALGLDDVALGRVTGETRVEVGQPVHVDPLVYASPAAFEAALASTVRSHQWFNAVRRIKFVCPDGTVAFRIYNTFLGVFNVPQEDVRCADGSLLLHYTQ